MTTLTPTARATAVTEPRARFWDLIASEWIKIRSLRSTYWGLGIAALAIIGSGIDAAYADYRNYPYYSANIHALFVPDWALRDAFSMNACLITILAASSIGAISVVGEYGTGMIRTTFAAVPARRSVLLAKMVTVTCLLAVFGMVVAAISFAASQAILDGRGVGMSFTDKYVLPSLAVSALMAPISGLIGMGFGTIIRHSAAAIITTVVALILMPFLVNSPTNRWSRDYHNAMPVFAWQFLTAQHGHSFRLPYAPTTTGSWVVLVTWPLVAAIIALISVTKRDV